jgi:RNA polymerase sigma factor (sigma-70 family)
MTDDLDTLRDEQLNQQLQQLLEASKPSESLSEDKSQQARQLAQQRIAKNRLITTIMQSGKLSKQGKWRSLSNFEDIYNEALQQTFLEIWQKIDSYNPEYAVMAWVNQIFNWRFQDLVSKEQKRGITNIPKEQGILKVRSLDELTKDIGNEEDISEVKQLKEIIEADPEQYLQNETIKGYPHVSLQVIILGLLDGQKWREISDELNVPLSSASSFYQRRLHKIIPYLQKYL